MAATQRYGDVGDTEYCSLHVLTLRPSCMVWCCSRFCYDDGAIDDGESHRPWSRILVGTNQANHNAYIHENPLCA